MDYTASKPQNPGKSTINDLERQNQILRKAKDSLFQKHLNFKVKQTRIIDQHKKQLDQAHSRISEQEKEIRFHNVYLREFMKKHIVMLPKELYKELESIADLNYILNLQV